MEGRIACRPRVKPFPPPSLPPPPHLHISLTPPTCARPPAHAHTHSTPRLFCSSAEITKLFHLRHHHILFAHVAQRGPPTRFGGRAEYPRNYFNLSLEHSITKQGSIQLRNFNPQKAHEFSDPLLHLQSTNLIRPKTQKKNLHHRRN